MVRTRHQPATLGYLLLAVCLLAACSRQLPRSRVTAPPPNGPAGSAQASPVLPVDPAQISRDFDGQAAEQQVQKLAQPAMQGRHVGTPGELMGANYIAGLFVADGLKPGGDAGSFLQSLPMTAQELASTPTLELRDKDGNTRALQIRDDFRPVFGGSAGEGDVSGPGLFVGPDTALSTLDLAGKVLFASPSGALKNLIARARAAGAKALLIPSGEQPILKSEGSPADTTAFPVAELSQSGAAALLEGSGHTRAELNAARDAGRPIPSFPLEWTVTYHVSLSPPSHIEAHNVLGVLPGVSDAKAIVVGAHYEEIGPDPDGVVYPAANDNASGVAVLLELASLLHRDGFHPSATIIFAAWSGHEEGLYGGKYYVEHPLKPIDQTSLYLNIDSVGQGSGATVDAYLSDAKLRNLAERAVSDLASHGQDARVRLIEKAIGDSDDITFRRAGVPAIALSWTGLLEGSKIHTPEDTAGAVDPEKLRITGAYATAVLLAAMR